MDKNVLTLIGIIAVCGTVLIIVDKQTSQNSQPQISQNSSTQAIAIPTPKSNQYVGSNNQYALIDGYTFVGGSETGDFYFKNNSAQYDPLLGNLLYGGVIRKETKNTSAELYKFYVDFWKDCKNGYGTIYQYNLSGGLLGSIDWASGVNDIPSDIAQFFCNLEQEETKKRKLNPS